MEAKIKAARSKHSRNKMALTMEIDGITFKGPGNVRKEEAERIITALRHRKKPSQVRLNANHGGTVAQVILHFQIDQLSLHFTSLIIRSPKRAREIAEKLEKWDLHIEVHEEK